MNIEETGNPTPAPSSEAEEGWKVTALDWERSIQIEAYREFEENGWSLPTGAELVSEREEIRTYRQEMVGSHAEDYEEQVYDHVEIVGYNQGVQGNGTVKLVPIIEPMYRTETRSREVPDYISVPVMDTKYYYKTRRWTLTRTVTASGNDHNPFWPDLNLADNEREAEKDSRCEIYRVEVKNTKNPDIVRIYCLSESDWLSVQTGDLLDLSLESLEE